MGPIDTYQHFLQLLQRHRAIMWERCWRYSDGDFDRCRDLVQEVTLHLCLHRDDLRPDVSENEEREWLVLLTRRTLYRRCLLLSLAAILIFTTTVMACTPSPDGVAINRSSLLKKAEMCQTLSATLSRHENL